VYGAFFSRVKKKEAKEKKKKSRVQKKTKKRKKNKNKTQEHFLRRSLAYNVTLS
jgi:hypothetical protein